MHTRLGGCRVATDSARRHVGASIAARGLPRAREDRDLAGGHNCGMTVRGEQRDCRRGSRGRAPASGAARTVGCGPERGRGGGAVRGAAGRHPHRRGDPPPVAARGRRGRARGRHRDRDRRAAAAGGARGSGAAAAGGGFPGRRPGARAAVRVRGALQRGGGPAGAMEPAPARSAADGDVRAGVRDDRGAQPGHDRGAADAGGARDRRAAAAAAEAVRLRLHAPGELRVAAAAGVEPDESARVLGQHPQPDRFHRRDGAAVGGGHRGGVRGVPGVLPRRSRRPAGNGPRTGHPPRTPNPPRTRTRTRTRARTRPPTGPRTASGFRCSRSPWWWRRSRGSR